MKALVIGAGGFLGGHIVRELLRGNDEIYAAVRPGREMSFDSDRVTLLPGDLTDASYVRRVCEGKDAIFFAAGRTWSPGLDVREFYRLNVETTRTFFAALQPQSGPRVVYTSSLSAIAGSAQPFVFTEQSGRSQVDEARLSPYDHAKIASEQLAMEYARQGGNVVVLNPGLLLGPGATAQSKLAAPQVLLWACQGKLPFFIDSGAGYCDVRDVAAAHVAAAARGRSGERYILSGHNLSRSEFQTLLAGLAGVRPPGKLPGAVLSAVTVLMDTLSALTANLIKSPLHRSFAHSLPLHYCGDSRKAIEELGYATRPLDETLVDSLRDDRRRGLLPESFAFVEALTPGNAALLVGLKQLAQGHAFSRFLLPRMPQIYAACAANHSLRAALQRALDQGRFQAKSGRFRWDRRASRQDLKTLGQFFEYLYFSSTGFLREVL